MVCAWSCLSFTTVLTPGCKTAPGQAQDTLQDICSTCIMQAPPSAAELLRGCTLWRAALTVILAAGPTVSSCCTRFIVHSPICQHCARVFESAFATHELQWLGMPTRNFLTISVASLAMLIPFCSASYASFASFCGNSRTVVLIKAANSG